MVMADAAAPCTHPGVRVLQFHHAKVTKFRFPVKHIAAADIILAHLMLTP
jgi:hypothetical protein